VDPPFHHQQASFEELLASEFSPEIIKLYIRLRAEAGLTGPTPPEDAKPVAAGPSTSVETAGGDLLRGRFHVETAQREEHIRRLAQENTALRQSLDDLKAQVSVMRDGMDAMREERHALARNLSATAERAKAVHESIAHKRARFAFLQEEVERTLKEAKPLAPRFFRCSNSINSLYRLFKRIRKSGKLFAFQREFNDATAESLGTLTHMAAMIAGHHDESYVYPPGLERYAIEKTRIDVPKLVDLLRIRLS
jgi:hypothetical protein